MISGGAITVGGVMNPKPASLVEAGTVIELVAEPPPFVGRGGLKLDGALDAFDLDVQGRRALDAGASTGGFTDVLLQRGAESVCAVDVGYGQLSSRLTNDPRVKVFDRTNIRNVGPDELGATFDLIVADLSFISLCTVAPALAALAEDGADLVLLVKPQFEVGRGDVGKGGIVRDSEARAGAVRSVIECLGRAGIGTQAVCASPVPGAKGNREFFVWCVRSAPTRDVEIPE